MENATSASYAVEERELRRLLLQLLHIACFHNTWKECMKQAELRNVVTDDVGLAIEEQLRAVVVSCVGGKSDACS